LEELKGLNPEVDMDHIKVGQEIVVRNDDLGAATDRTYARRDPEVPLVRSGQSGEPVVAVETVPFARGPKAEEAGGLKLSMLLIPAAVSLFLGWMGGRWLGDKIEKSGSARARPVGSTSWDQSAAAAASPGRASASPSPSSGDPAPSPPGRASAKAVDEKPGGARWSNWLKPAASAAAAAGEKAMRSVGAKMPGQGVEPRAANAPSDKRNSSGSSANRTKRSIYSPPENSKEQVPRSITQEITQTKTMTQSQSGSAERKQQLQQLQRAQSTLKQLETERTQLQRNMMDKQSKIKMMMDQEGQSQMTEQFELENAQRQEVIEQLGAEMDHLMMAVQGGGDVQLTKSTRVTREVNYEDVVGRFQEIVEVRAEELAELREAAASLEDKVNAQLENGVVVNLHTGWHLLGRKPQ